MPRLNNFDTKASGLNPEDEARLSSLIFDHINLLGRYAFSVPELLGSVSSGRSRTPGDPLEDSQPHDIRNMPVYVSLLKRVFCSIAPDYPARARTMRRGDGSQEIKGPNPHDSFR